MIRKKFGKGRAVVAAVVVGLCAVLPVGLWAAPPAGGEPCLGQATLSPGRQVAGKVTINSLSGSQVLFSPTGGDPCFVNAGSQTFCFQADSYTNDWEWVYTLWLRFPNGWTVTDVVVSGTPSCTNGGSFDPMGWSLYNGTTNEVRIDHPRYQSPTDHCTAVYCVTVTPGGPPLAGDASVSWYWDGDGYGSSPHWPCSNDGYTPAGQSPCDESVLPPATVPICTGLVLTAGDPSQEGCLGSDVTYDVSLANYTGAAATFDISYTGNAWPVAGPATVGPLADGEKAHFTVTHSVPASATPGQIDAVTVTAADQGNPATNDSVTLSTTATDVMLGEGPHSPTGHMDNVVVAYGGKLYNIGGYGSNGAVDIYDPATNTWTSGATEPAPNIQYAVDGAVGVDAGGHAVVVLFPDIASGVSTLHVYDLDTNSWSTPALPAGFPASGIWAPDIVCDPASNRCYITGGATTPGGGNLTTAYVYDVAANTLTALPPFTSARDFHASFLYNGKLCIAGGVNSGSAVLSSTQCYDFGLGAWGAENADVAALPFGLFGMGDGVLDLSGTPTPILAGGADEEFALSGDILTYDGTAWNVAGSLPHPVYRVEGETLGNLFYLAGGSTGSFSASAFLQYFGPCSVGCPSITVTPAPPLPAMQRGVFYSVTFGASGGTGPYTFTLTGDIPPGLTWDASTATLSGTPTWVGDYAFTVEATDAGGCTGSESYTLASLPNYGMHFHDNYGRSDLCIDTVTGSYKWTVLTPPGAVYEGMGVSANGGTAFWTVPSDPVYIYATYDARRKRARAYMNDTGTGLYSTIVDTNTTDNGPCP